MAQIEIGRIGIWTRQLEDQPAAKAQETAAELEQLGYGALWFGEAMGREAFSNAGLLLAGTRRMVIATGIANIYARDPVATAAGQKTLAEAYPGRFLLGLGVSHIPLVEQLRGHRYEKPVATMRGYLEAMDKAPYRSAAPAVAPARVLAALGPKMLELAAARSDGAHPYNVNPEHTAEARRIMGKGPLLCPEQAMVLERDAAKAREIGRKFLGFYLTLPNYTNNFLRLGFKEADFQNGGSDRLIDSMIAWGDLETIRKRIREHHAAGADHVCVQVLTADPQGLPLAEWRELAAAVLPG
ncbi:MAG TPA: LLM class F420-dependent oxidoreductase, partial [Bryobacteraceae bacterium]|nr:LLM class F420-dependent oxidoreductase [Bryobacteraceae bacterium]